MAEAALSRVQHARLVVAIGLVVSTTVTWRVGDYYSGGVDPTVAAKGVLGVVAAVLATLALRDAPARRPVRLSVPVYLVLYCTVSLLGAWATGGLLLASAVLFARLGLLTFTVFALLRVFDSIDVLRVFGFWLARTALVASITGSTAGHLATGLGRLTGGYPPLLPNEMPSYAHCASCCCCGTTCAGVAGRRTRSRCWRCSRRYGLLDPAQPWRS